MQNHVRIISSLILLCGLVLLGSGCSPDAKKNSHLQSADRFFDSGELSNAEVEYLNVLKLDPQNPRAIGRLGLIYSEQGRLASAVAFLRKGNELKPDDLELRIKLGELALVTGNPKGAQEHANFVLEHRPTDVEAPQLLIAAASKPEELDAMRQRLLSLPPAAANGAPVLAALGVINLRQGKLKEAEALLRQALTVDPKSATAHTILGTMYVAQKNSPAAAQEFKLAAEASPIRSSRRIQYAQFLIQTGDSSGGKKLLTEITQKAPDYVPAWVTLAETALAEKNFPESSDYVAKALARDPGNLDALLLGGRLQIARGENDQAIATFDKLTSTYPKMPMARLYLARAYAASGDLGQAIDQLNQAVNIAPGYADAVLLLANLQIRKGDGRSAILLLKKMVQQRPELAQARLLLADAYLAQGDVDAALEIYRQIDRQYPGNPQVPILLGSLFMQQQKPEEARKAFTRAYELAPDNPAVLEPLVNLDLMERKYPAARERVEAALARNPKLASSSQLLFAKIFLAQKDFVQAEAALKKVIELSPDAPTAYFLLAGVYNTTNQQEKALASLGQAVARNPKDVTANLLIGAISEKQKDYSAARDAYLRVLAVSSNSISALNNLAYIYSERLGELDKGYELAQRARALQPNSPNIADTLGWILYNRHQYPRALILLQESAEKLPNSPEVFYHLGMAHYMMGEEGPARVALQRAMKSETEFAGQEEAKKSLSVLDVDASRSSAELRQMLTKVLADKKNDPVALARLAAIDEREGNRVQAIASLESALIINEKNVNALLSLARLQSASGNGPKAIEAAKNARKLAPGDSDVAHTLGRIAYDAHDYQWAASLLSEAARKQSDSAEFQFDLARADYAIGQVPEAATALRAALQLGGEFFQAGEAKRFLEFISLAATPTEATKAAAKTDDALKATPDYVPALMVSAALNEIRPDPATAAQTYEKVLGIFPDFSPAKVRLAILGAAKPEFDAKAYQWATQARAIYPDDPELAKALGILTYRKGDYARSVALLKESSRARDRDPEVWYFLGLGQHQQKLVAESKKSLQRALDLGVKPDFAAEAKRVLTEVK